MSKLDELLQGVDVEWLALGKIANFLNGKGHEKAISDDGKYIVVNSKFVSSEGKIIKYSDVQIVPLYIDDILIVMSDLPNGKALAKTFLVEENDKYTLNQRIGRISVINKNALLPKYLNYILNRNSDLLKFNNGVDQTNLKKNQILEVSIPIPCPDNPEKSLEIQQEIVRVLDELTSLTNQLTTELETERQNRKKQFEFFREQLLSFEKGEAEWKSLGEILNRTKGTKITASQMKELDKENGSIKIFAGGKTVAFFDANDLPEKDINLKPSIIVKSRGIIEFEYYDKPFSHKNEMWSYHSTNDQIEIKYIYYFLKINELHFQNIGKRMQMPQISIPHTDKFKIPLISMEDQKRIVKLLDQFDATHTAIEEEITKEIKLRTQQYEYYREKLLSFPQN